MIRARLAGGAPALLLFALSGVGCGSKTVVTPTAPAPVAEAASRPPRRPVGSVVETQNSGPAAGYRIGFRRGSARRARATGGQGGAVAKEYRG